MEDCGCSSDHNPPNSSEQVSSPSDPVSSSSDPVRPESDLKGPIQLVCTSGAATGVHCDIITDRISTTALVRTGPSSFERVDMMVMGSQLDFNGVAAGSGDSGGPVFTLTHNFADVLAAGTMSIAQFSVPCNVAGVPFCGNRGGSSTSTGSCARSRRRS